MPLPEYEEEKNMPTRHSFRKDKFEGVLNIQTFAGGQTTLNGKDAPMAFESLQTGVNPMDGSYTAHASIFDSTVLKNYAESLGGEEVIREKYRELTKEQGGPEVDPDADLDDPVELFMPVNVPASIPINPPLTSVGTLTHLEIDALLQGALTKQASLPQPIETAIETSFDSNARRRLVRASADPVSAPVEVHLPKITVCNSANCNAKLPAGAKFCSECGKPQLGKFCTNCGHQFQGAEVYCPMCRSPR